MEHSPEKKKEEIKYQGKILEIIERRENIDGREIKFEIARRAPGTRLIIENEKGNLLISKEWRYELNDYDYRLPGGKVFDSLDEYNNILKSKENIEPYIQTAALKEAKEEMGVDAKTISKIAVSKCGATIEWDLHYFVLRGEKGEQNLEHGEKIEVIEISKEEAKKMCLNGQMTEERSAMNLLRYLTKF